MDRVREHTATEKGLKYLNMMGILGVLVMFFLLPILGLIGGPRAIIYAFSIAFTVVNIGFYLAPANYKAQFLQKRLLFVYLPTIIVLGIDIWDFVMIVIHLSIT